MIYLVVIVSGVLSGIAAVTVRHPGHRIGVTAAIVLATWVVLIAMVGLDPVQVPDKGALIAWAVTFVLVTFALGAVKIKRTVYKKFPELRLKRQPKRRR